ncbi:MAG TPA: TVP38/TMEM64 family protein [Candidatus Avacidaminococcus intestinavium]|uniref:TVP38/TMEM64 family membrane protein n=1 Tax=Candidatus Avacidaminococcus intestinavium TaxID=2840684 RepID=A0A9D1MQJ0_9FIRM|nr:TVP38/TMEM64 family protein [Candidatus Avacidaminococcus intestinavium]
MPKQNKAWYEQESSVKIIAFLLILLLFGAIYLLLPDFFSTVITLITSGNVNELIEFLRSFGVWAVVISFFLDILINAVGFLPSIFISTANGILFGLPLGILVSWLAETIGVIISFLLMRYFFRSSAEIVISKSQNLERLNELSGQKGLQVMAILRTLPYFPSGILTALGAVSKMSVRDYVIANFIGKFPSTALEVIVGHDVINFRQNMDRLALIATLIALIYGYILWRNHKKKDNI